MGIIQSNKYMLIGVGVAAIGLIYLVTKKGAAGAAGAAVGGAVVEAAGGAVTGVVDGISGAVGLPTTSETIKDAKTCRIYMDANGIFKATAACSAPAFLEALTMPSEPTAPAPAQNDVSGTNPISNNDIGMDFNLF